VTSSVAVFEVCDMGKINVYDKVVMKKKKKRENMEIEKIHTLIST